jgi:hypothetical protein
MFSTPLVRAEAPLIDANLVMLGQQFAEIVRALDDRDWLDAEPLAKLAEVEGRILNTQAVTMEGLYVKAQAACWALLGDLDPMNESTTDRRMAVSIIRDLVRLHEPGLEQPGALKKLVADLD